MATSVATKATRETELPTWPTERDFGRVIATLSNATDELDELKCTYSTLLDTKDEYEVLVLTPTTADLGVLAARSSGTPSSSSAA